MEISKITTQTTSAPVCLNIHKGKSKILRYNTACNNPITLHGEDLEGVKTFTYLDSIIDQHSESDADVKARISKARAACLQLKNIWNSKQLSTNTKLSTQNTLDLLARHYQQQPTLGENKPDSSAGTNQEEALGLDRTHIEITQLRHKASPHLDFSRPKEKWKTKEHITSRNEARHEKNEQQLDRSGKEGPEQNGLENAIWWLMLHLE
ncbi:unnamed protein product [Schistosoma mattheei]|uniref:Uncharacterized protein n=1 Tax=Schistosoma mattheei TaxID=31246 RepID=A0A183PDJ3_9TREM|nr:unnamed protein product [Schistosoma mattheei]